MTDLRTKLRELVVEAGSPEVAAIIYAGSAALVVEQTAPGGKLPISKPHSALAPDYFTRKAQRGRRSAIRPGEVTFEDAVGVDFTRLDDKPYRGC